MANPFIAECRKLHIELPSGFLKQEYPYWNENQVINFWWSGDINDTPDEIEFSLSENPYLPASVAFGIRPQNQVQKPNQVQDKNLVPVQAQQINSEDENDFQTPPGLPGQPVPSAPTRAAQEAGTAGLAVPTPTRNKPTHSTRAYWSQLRLSQVNGQLQLRRKVVLCQHLLSGHQIPTTAARRRTGHQAQPIWHT